jgi:Zn finger protein HypA/HybF involved in hydrogenase expression
MEKTGMQPDMCWNCNEVYHQTEKKCPKCGATNPNVDMDTAMQEVEDKTLITGGKDES